VTVPGTGSTTESSQTFAVDSDDVIVTEKSLILSMRTMLRLALCKYLKVDEIAIDLD
jgi:hypothetical protein